MKTRKLSQVRVGIVLSYITLAANVLVSVFFTPYVLKQIGSDQYGLHTFVNSMASYLSVFVSSLSAAYIRFATIQTNEDGDPSLVNTIFGKLFLLITGIVCLVASLASIVLFFGGIQFGEYSAHERELINVMFVISSAQVAITILFTVFGTYNNYKKQFIAMRLIALLVVILNVLFTYVGIVLGGDVLVVSISQFITNTISVIVQAVVAKINGFRFAKAKLADNLPLVKSVSIFCSFILLNSIVDLINNSVDKTILGFTTNGTTVTTYQLGQTFYTYLISMSVSISSSFTPQINQLVLANKTDEWKNLFLKISKIQSIVVMFIVGGFLSSGYAFVKAWLQGTETDVVAVYIIASTLLVLATIPATQNASIEIQRAFNKHKFRGIAYILVALFNVMLSLILVFTLPAEFKIYGCLVGTIIAWILGYWILINWYNWKKVGIPIPTYLKSFVVTAIVAGVSVGISFLISYFTPITNLSPWLSFFVEAAVYSAAYLFLTVLCFHKDVKYSLAPALRFFRKRDKN